MIPRTTLPLPFITFKHWGLDDREVGVMVVKATAYLRWRGEPGHSMIDMVGRLDEQPALVTNDKPFAAPLGHSLGGESVEIEQEIAPFKQGGEVIVTGTAKAPNTAQSQPQQLSDWPVAISLASQDGQALCVTTHPLAFIART